jgi:hypothetical protein
MEAVFRGLWGWGRGEGDILKGGYAGFTFDEGAEKRLWEVSCGLVAVEDE